MLMKYITSIIYAYILLPLDYNILEVICEFGLVATRTYRVVTVTGSILDYVMLLLI